MVESRSGEIPSDERNSRAAWARFAPRARLYSLVPRSSQWPSISTRAEGLLLSQSAFARSVARASVLRSYRSKSNITSLSGLDAGVIGGLPSCISFKLLLPVLASFVPPRSPSPVPASPPAALESGERDAEPSGFAVVDGAHAHNI